MKRHTVRGHWRFPAMLPSQVNQDPVHGEFFTIEEFNLALRLVRETIQNSMDARATDSKSVRVNFIFSGENEHALSNNITEIYLTGLKPHFEAATSFLTNNDQGIEAASEIFERSMPYLVIEDFGTTGLRGEVKANGKLESENDFWGLFRSVGITPKGDDSGGSWGLGKWVFPDASRISSFFGITYRGGEEDKNKLMGMTVLKTHELNELKYPPYGWFAHISEELDESWLPMPIESDDEIMQFCEDFDLGERIYEPGLSIVIPYPKQNLEFWDVVHSAISQYFLPIVKGELVVCVSNRNNGKKIEIEADSIIECIKELAQFDSQGKDSIDTCQQLEDAVALAIFSQECIKNDNFIVVDSGHGSPDKMKFADLKGIQDRYESGEKLAFKITISVKPKNSNQVTNAFYVFLQKNLEQIEGFDIYVREHLRIPNMRMIGNYQVKSLVLVDGKTDLGHMLRDAEGPSHDKWNENSQRLKENWTVGTRVKFVKNSVANILNALQPETNKLKYETLADIFPDNQQNTSLPIRPGPEPNPPDPNPFPPLPPNPVPFRIHRSNGQISIKNSENRASVGSQWNLQIAYGVAYEGNQKAFRNYRRAYDEGYPDFYLNYESVQVKTIGCTAEISKGNNIRFTINDEAFEILVCGFDNRDLAVQIIPAEESSDGEICYET